MVNTAGPSGWIVPLNACRYSTRIILIFSVSPAIVSRLRRRRNECGQAVNLTPWPPLPRGEGEPASNPRPLTPFLPRAGERRRSDYSARTISCVHSNRTTWKPRLRVIRLTFPGMSAYFRTDSDKNEGWQDTVYVSPSPHGCRATESVYNRPTLVSQSLAT